MREAKKEKCVFTKERLDRSKSDCKMRRGLILSIPTSSQAPVAQRGPNVFAFCQLLMSVCVLGLPVPLCWSVCHLLLPLFVKLGEVAKVFFVLKLPLSDFGEKVSHEEKVVYRGK